MKSQLPLNETPTQPHAGACGCHSQQAELPTLDARAIVPRLRHAAILGALEALTPGEAMGLIAPHNPVPLLQQIGDKYGDGVEVSYLSEDPWTLKFTRV
ncbi:DUF2249 domain-containing protein [Corynebacterium pseudotuberculosis]|uniref:DUF2249 domain-containing protein n=1 Tax=Corynebacterium pseudotuberculosis TaxID=1719 RepID=UPI0002660AF1|nr:DUF2249 domain-containing protein [Corynebacterium pseudotuberculosis]AFM06915.1 DUF2249 domain-containing protein [Corynebacterium pseudotuberculosis Cp162]